MLLLHHLLLRLMLALPHTGCLMPQEDGVELQLRRRDDCVDTSMTPNEPRDLLYCTAAIQMSVWCCVGARPVTLAESISDQQLQLQYARDSW